ncbi:MAG: hypothetical protein E2P06_14960 [Acidobacteria bacterium]|nr:MAG: hypothetical protein E2P06_14960 [Acidobacteriota bacterium]
MTTTCLQCGNRETHEMVSSIGGTWHRCARCHYAWRGLDPALEEPGATALQDDHPASAAPLSVSLAQLGAMDADLLQVGNTFARSDAAFLRLVSRWHPVAVPVV